MIAARDRARAWAASLLLLLTLPRAARAQDDPDLPDTRGPAPAPAPPDAPAPAPAPLYVIPPYPTSSTRDEPRFGAKGSFALDADASAFVRSTRYGGADTVARNLIAGVAVDGHYFVFRNIALGASLGASYGYDKAYEVDGSLFQSDVLSLRAAARVAFNVPLGARVSLFPRVALGVESVRAKRESLGPPPPGVPSIGVADTRSSRVGPWVSASLPLVLHPARHVFVGLGPGVTYSGGRDDARTVGKVTTFYVTSFLGAWWGGRDDEARPPVAPPDPHAPRFGDKRAFVLTGALGLGLSRTTSIAPGHSAQVFVAPSLDFFVTESWSLGGSAGVVYGEQDTVLSANARAFTSQRTLFVAPRVGYNARLSDAVSWWFQGGLVMGSTRYDQRLATAESYSVTELGVTFDAPLLVHVSPNVFVGAGPGLGVSVLVYPPDVAPEDLTATYFRAASVVGVWW
ncbi:MAG: hypothetical protein R3B36_25510 [Polyangiaceae bacterium]